jgi:hypothetical protein
MLNYVRNRSGQNARNLRKTFRATRAVAGTQRGESLFARISNGDFAAAAEDTEDLLLRKDPPESLMTERALQEHAHSLVFKH